MKKTFVFLAVVTVLSVGYFMLHRTEPVTAIGHTALPERTSTEMFEKSDAIVTGVITEVSTQNRLQIDYVLKGDASINSSIITIKTLGGTDGDLQMHVEGSPEFKKGEHVLVFLTKQADGTYTIYGWQDGAYSLDEKGLVGMSVDETDHFEKIFGKNHSISIFAL